MKIYLSIECKKFKISVYIDDDFRIKPKYDYEYKEYEDYPHIHCFDWLGIQTILFIN